MSRTSIRRLDPSEAVAAIPALAEVLVDCVDGGASVSFMPPMTMEKATRFWRMVAEGVARGERALLVAEDEAGQVIGTVQLVLAMPEEDLPLWQKRFGIYQTKVKKRPFKLIVFRKKVPISQQRPLLR